MKNLLVASVAAAVLLAPAPAHAANDTHRVIIPGPVVCHLVRCAQDRDIVLYTHGEVPVTIVQRRTAPREARTQDRVLHWTKWANL